MVSFNIFDFYMLMFQCFDGGPTAGFSARLNLCDRLSWLQEVDLLLMQWDIAYMQLEKAETTFEDSELLERPEHNLRCCGCTGWSHVILHMCVPCAC